MSTRWRAHRLMAAGLTVFVACGSSAHEPEPAAAASPSPRPAQSSPQYQTGSLDQIMAPIALYPDQLLAQILMSAGEPGKVAELESWLKANANLKGTELQNAAVKAGFEPSFVALALFPQVVTTMAEQIAWTTMLGQAFIADKTAVFNSIQKLRQQARNVGTLKTNSQQEVETKTTSTGEQVIVIEPANPQVVYVPVYNTEVVYTQAPTTTTVIVQEDNHDEAVAAGLIGFTAGIAIGASMNNNYYYGPYGWHGGAYMYNDAWDDYYDHREDAREDWMDHREDMNEERSERRENTAEQRTDRQENRAENRPEAQQQRTERQQNRQENPSAARQQAQTAAQNRAASGTQSTQRTGSTTARGYGDSSTRTQATQRSGGSDAFSGYSSGSSQRAASSRGQSSRSSSRGSRGGGGGGRRR